MVKFMCIKLLACIFLFAFINDVYAQTAPERQTTVYSWDTPTQRVDNKTPLVAADIANFEIAYKLKTSTVWPEPIILGSGARTYTAVDQVAGAYDARIRVGDKQNLWSEWAELIGLPNPKPPSNFKATVTKTSASASTLRQ